MWVFDGAAWGPGVMLLLAAAALYVAGNAAVGAVTPSISSGSPDTSNPSHRALMQWLPIVATVLAAVLLGFGGMAVAIVFGTSLACLTLVLGMATYAAPLQTAGPRRRAWAFVAPAAMLCLMAGFAGSLTWVHAVVLILLGMALLTLWQTEVSGDYAPSRLGESMLNGTQLVLAILLAGIGGWAAIMAAVNAGRSSQITTPSVVAVGVLSPMLILAALRSSTTLAERGNPEAATSSLIGTVLLNLCVLLPVAILIWYFRTGWAATAAPHHSLRAILVAGQTLPYPLGVWRIETILLLIVGLLLLPVALGRWNLTRRESAALILGYAIYLIFVVWSIRDSVRPSGAE